MLAVNPAPTDFETVTSPEWLGAVLGARVERVEVVGRGRSLASKLRIRVTWVDPQCGLPAELFLKGFFSAEDAGFAWVGEPEARFYRDIAPLLSARIPRCFHAGVDEEKRHGLLIQEDLEAQGCRFFTPLDATSADGVAAALEQFAHVHADTWNRASLRSPAFLAPVAERFLTHPPAAAHARRAARQVVAGRDPQGRANLRRRAQPLRAPRGWPIRVPGARRRASGEHLRDPRRRARSAGLADSPARALGLGRGLQRRHVPARGGAAPRGARAPAPLPRPPRALRSARARLGRSLGALPGVVHLRLQSLGDHAADRRADHRRVLHAPGHRGRGSRNLRAARRVSRRTRALSSARDEAPVDGEQDAGHVARLVGGEV